MVKWKTFKVTILSPITTWTRNFPSRNKAFQYAMSKGISGSIAIFLEPGRFKIIIENGKIVAVENRYEGDNEKVRSEIEHLVMFIKRFGLL